jgi:hypothetical protein
VRPYPACPSDLTCMSQETCRMNFCSVPSGIVSRLVASVQYNGYFEANITVTYYDGTNETVAYSPRGTYPLWKSKIEARDSLDNQSSPKPTNKNSALGHSLPVMGTLASLLLI